MASFAEWATARAAGGQDGARAYELARGAVS